MQLPHRKTVKFCCGKCRQVWWNTHPEQINKKALYSFTCVCCGKSFTAYGNSSRKYCSHDCYTDWQYVGVYADNGISGTGTAKRDEFQHMLDACEAGKIDIILTKSISRFARNTVDLLKTVRHLKELCISVRFEKENIDSLSEDGELMLTLLGSFAQEESRSISDNVKWGTVKRFQQGIPNGHFPIYGYRWQGDTLVIEPEEAKIVRLIFDNFLKGLSAETTEKQLEAMGVKSYKGMHFGSGS